MTYFRIEDTASSAGIKRTYWIEPKDLPIKNKQEVESYIAEEIRKEVNGSNDRNLLSYSRSLGVCLLKYNNLIHNELHICDTGDLFIEDAIFYVSPNNHCKCKDYSLTGALSPNYRLFKGDDEITLCNFVLNIGNNKLLNDYLVKFTNTGLKQYASPEKDYEVVMMQAFNDAVIENYIDSIYILYALQLKYNFLNSPFVVGSVIEEVLALEDFPFQGCEQEREAIITLIEYLYENKPFETFVFKRVFRYFENRDYYTAYYDSLLQLYNIIYDDFETAWHTSDYNDNVVSEIFWKYCGYYGKNLRQRLTRPEDRR